MPHYAYYSTLLTDMQSNSSTCTSYAISHAIILYNVVIIVVIISEKRQTVLFSATQTKKTEDLARVSLKKAPLYVGVDDDKMTSTVEGLEQVINTSTDNTW